MCEMKHIELVDIFKYHLHLAYLITSADDPLNSLIYQLAPSALRYLLVFIASVNSASRIISETKLSLQQFNGPCTYFIKLQDSFFSCNNILCSSMCSHSTTLHFYNCIHSKILHHTQDNTLALQILEIFTFIDIIFQTKKKMAFTKKN